MSCLEGLVERFGGVLCVEVLKTGRHRIGAQEKAATVVVVSYASPLHTGASGPSSPHPSPDQLTKGRPGPSSETSLRERAKKRARLCAETYTQRETHLSPLYRWADRGPEMTCPRVSVVEMGLNHGPLDSESNVLPAIPL